MARLFSLEISQLYSLNKIEFFPYIACVCVGGGGGGGSGGGGCGFSILSKVAYYIRISINDTFEM